MVTVCDDGSLSDQRSGRQSWMVRTTPRFVTEVTASRRAIRLMTRAGSSDARRWRYADPGLVESGQFGVALWLVRRRPGDRV